MTKTILRIGATAGAALFAFAACAWPSAEVQMLPDEGWWGLSVGMGSYQPFTTATEPITFDLRRDNFYSETSPVLVSSAGRWIWCDEPMIVQFRGKGRIVITSSKAPIRQGCAKEGTLRAAYLECVRRFFRPSRLPDRTAPDELLVAAPQYNTWVELGPDQVASNILAYAKGFLDRGYPAGALMVDDGWQRGFGDWRFRADFGEKPERVMAKLHAMGFKTMLWCAPMVATNAPDYGFLEKAGALVRDDTGAPRPSIWWNGMDAMLDLRTDAAQAWMKARLESLHCQGVDGFKFDGGDASDYLYDNCRLSELWGTFGLDEGFNEFRACWKMGGKPLMHRIQDTGANMAAQRGLIPAMIAAGLIGHPFVCPDMVGGGARTAFLEGADPEVIVRSAQIHALSPMMQFSAAPWRWVDETHQAAIKKAVDIRMAHKDYLLAVFRASAKTGEPMLRPLEYAFPHAGYLREHGEFMLGDDLLVAPQLKHRALEREVRIPDGTWTADDGTKVTGPTKITVRTPLDRLPYFTRVK